MNFLNRTRFLKFYLAAVFAIAIIASDVINADPSNDSIRSGITDKWQNTIQDENGKKILTEEEGDALQMKVFNGVSGNDYYGVSVKSAGDVNGDGYDDMIVGARGYNNNTGRAYIYFGGATVNTAADVVMTGESSFNFYGYSVSGAGDVNGDGFDDVLVGAYQYNTNQGRTYLYLGGSVMNNTADLVMTGETTSNGFGYSVSGAGDVNGDGYDDMIIGALDYNSTTGRAYVYYGGAVLNNVADVVMTGAATLNNFGGSVSGAGDINGDGYEDVIVGARGYSSNTGRAYIYYGGSVMNNVVDVTMTGESAGSRFGNVSDAGDVNGDGYSDVIVGASWHNSSTGRAYVYCGGTNMNNTADVVVTGEGTNNLFGEGVSTAGDVNGDGYSDVIIGAYFYGAGSGKIYVLFGNSIMDNIPDVTRTGSASSFFGFSVATAGDMNGDGFSDILAGANYYNGLTGRVYLYDYFMRGEIDADKTIQGEFVGDSFGRSVSDAGDVNGDGYDDYLVGAGAYNNNTGRAYIYYGGSISDEIPDVILNGESVSSVFGTSVSSAGDVNGDGFDDVIAGAYGYNSSVGRAYIYFGGSPMNNVPDVYLNGEFASNYFGIVVSGSGDVNGDGFHDVLVSATGYSSSTGKAYLYFGGASMDNAADQSFTGENTFDNFGAALSGAGDVNADGYADIVIGADTYNLNTGKAYVYLGGNFISPFPYITINGAATYNNFGCSVAGAGDVNGDGFGDIIAGAYGYNNYSGIAYIFYGGSIMDVFADVYFPEVTSARLGSSVSGAGDVNGDGFADVIIGAPGYYIESGRSYILFGGTYMDNIADVSMKGDTAFNYFGSSVSGLGDINGDGFSDFISSAPNFGQARGKTNVYTSSAININPNLLSVKDFPNDQGGKVQLRWARSGYDVRGINKITGYTIFRSFPPSGGNFNWQSIAEVTAENLPFYYYLDNTPVDSSSSNSGVYYYRIKAKTNNQNEYWYSDILYGRSVDNLAPLAVSGFGSFDESGSVRLRWNRNIEPDLYNYVLYRNTTPSVDPNLATPIASTTDTIYTDSSPLSGLYYYFILAQDIHNNKSPIAITESPSIVINLSALLQGSYNPSSNIQISDTVRAYLRYAASPFAISDSSKSVLSSGGSATIRFANAMSGNYYIVIKHRNSIETWNASGTVMSRGATYNYNFSIAPTQAYGSNLIQVDASPVRFAIFSGDVTQDGTVDATDLSQIDNDANNFVNGYVVTDLTGDNFVDGTDFAIADNNAANFVSVIRP